MPVSKTHPNNNHYNSYPSNTKGSLPAPSGRGGWTAPIGDKLSSGPEHDSPESETSPRQHSDSDDVGTGKNKKTPRREPRDDPFRRFHIAWRQPFKPTTTIVKVWDQATTRADPALILKGTAKYVDACTANGDEPDPPAEFLNRNLWALFLDATDSEAIGYCDECDHIVPQQGRAPDCETQYKRAKT